MVANDTRVVPARIPIEQPRGEVLLLERSGENGVWEALARPTRRLKPGRRYGPVELLEHLGEGRWLLRLEGEPAGEAPLPPYITERSADPGRYQTVYADEAGSAAAPTAGLHFTPELLARLDVELVTLHVGLDTFRPVSVDDLDEHRLHGERYHVRPEAWQRIAAAERVLAVGTTTVRVLESHRRRRGPQRPHRPVRHAGVRVPPRRRAADELPPAPLDAAGARHGLRRNGRDPRAVPRGDCRALPLLLLRRCHARPVTTAFEVTATDGAARAGVLRTAHGDVPTPAFMPVGTKGTVKSVDPDELVEVGASIVLGNSYHLHFKPGEDVIAGLGGLHGFMAWDGPILTDSGGFQVFSLRDTLLGRGRRRRDVPLRLRRRPRALHARSSPPRSRRSSAPTSRCASTCARPRACPAPSWRRRPGAPRSGPPASARRRGPTGQLLFGIAQGGADPELRRRSIEEIVALDFDGHALGGLSVGETPRADVRHGQLGGAAAAGREGRATSWASATPRESWR